MDVDETPEVRGQETGSGEEETESGSEHEAEVRGRLSFRDAPRAGMPTQTWRSLSQLNQSNKGEAERRRLAGRRRRSLRQNSRDYMHGRDAWRPDAARSGTWVIGRKEVRHSIQADLITKHKSQLDMHSR